MIGLLIYLLIVVVIFGAVVYVVRLLPLAEPFRSVVYVLLLLVFILVLLSLLGIIPGGPWPRAVA